MSFINDGPAKRRRNIILIIKLLLLFYTVITHLTFSTWLLAFYKAWIYLYPKRKMFSFPPRHLFTLFQKSKDDSNFTSVSF